VTRTYLNRIGTAVPEHDIHAEFVDFGRTVLDNPHHKALWDRMAGMAEIAHRYAVVAPGPKPRDVALDRDGFFRRGAFPGTRARMDVFVREALPLAERAVAALDLGHRRRDVTHLIVACCTGFSAPGLDFQLMQALGLRASVERTMIGFMGCFAAANALRMARHIVRSEPASLVLVVNLELSSLHVQEDWELARMLSFLIFGDGCAASLVSAEPVGIELGAFHTEVIPRSEGLITWHVGDTGFLMHLSGQVPGRIRRFLLANGEDVFDKRGIAHWAVHAGGRSVLDAVQHGLDLPPAALAHSRGVLHDYGNMSSATLVFVLDRILRGGVSGDGIAMAFGPGLTVESFRFRR
jgi:predicted naringenin-chalcone synthase